MKPEIHSHALLLTVVKKMEPGSPAGQFDPNTVFDRGGNIASVACPPQIGLSIIIGGNHRMTPPPFVNKAVAWRCWRGMLSNSLCVRREIMRAYIHIEETVVSSRLQEVVG